MSTTTCQACGSTTPRPRIVRRVESGNHICRCSDCNVLFVEPMPTEPEITEYYQGFTYGRPDPLEDARLESTISANVGRIVEDLRSAGCQFGTALDFGGGVGYYANAFVDHFQSVDLLEVDNQAIALATERFPNRFGVIKHQPGLVPEFTTRYDLVFANQVIEHYSDLRAFFEAIQAAAHDGSVIVITTPNSRSRNLWFRPEIVAHYAFIGSNRKRLRDLVSLARRPWAYCEPPRHLFSFDLDNLARAIARHGLRPIRTWSVHCIDDYYSPAKYRRGPSRFRYNFLDKFSRNGIRLMRYFDHDGRRGDDLVVLARVVRAS